MKIELLNFPLPGRLSLCRPWSMSHSPGARCLVDTLDSGERLDNEGTFAEWMSHMDDIERESLVLRFVEDLDYREITEPPGGDTKCIFRSQPAISGCAEGKGLRGDVRGSPPVLSMSPATGRPSSASAC